MLNDRTYAVLDFDGLQVGRGASIGGMHRRLHVTLRRIVRSHRVHVLQGELVAVLGELRGLLVLAFVRPVVEELLAVNVFQVPTHVHHDTVGGAVAIGVVYKSAIESRRVMIVKTETTRKILRDDKDRVVLLVVAIGVGVQREGGTVGQCLVGGNLERRLATLEIQLVAQVAVLERVAHHVEELEVLRIGTFVNVDVEGLVEVAFQVAR